ncbi:MAG TPA: xanthine dehydrogenase molybdopterin binding subunit [Burkholderiales bacterium]|nr:xanthine dehydrogenase molybdopterin binding subunit [Burkholderiales bacterium]
MKAERPFTGRVHEPLPHDSAALHVSGEARYVDDLPEPPGTLFAAFGRATIAHGRIVSMDLEPVRRAAGIVAVIKAGDIPGINNIGPVVPDEPLLAVDTVEYHGQPLFIVAATSVEGARRAALLARVEYEPRQAIVTVDQALAQEQFVLPSVTVQKGDIEKLRSSEHCIRQKLRCGGQEHFYLEGQVALAIPGERGTMLVHSSTQHPTEVQHLVAAALDVADAAVTVEVRRLGGGFGGKETQAAPYAIAAALLAQRTGRAVKLRADRDDDIIGTGKRHDFVYEYEIGFSRDGTIDAYDVMLASRCGLSADLSGAVNERAIFHCDNAYFVPAMRIVNHRCRTNTVSNTAFRGFGGPQGMFAIEAAIAAIARRLDLDPLDVRKRNLYGDAPRNVTHYGQALKDNVLPPLIEDLEVRADYRARRKALKNFNDRNSFVKKGLALTPVKFGIAFTNTPMNQGGALVHIYTDGSVHLSHGGTEMGQGLLVKVAQMVADELEVDLSQVHITPTSTGKVPNTSPTAASSGTDINGEAARAACRTLKERLAPFREKHPGYSFTQIVREAYLARVSLSATGYWRTPEIHFDRERWQGEPFYYFAYGAAVSEVAVDTLTGEFRLLRADLLHDVGRSVNPAIDRGQVEGGFIQGMGWLTMEEVVWDADGRLLTHAPSTYKIPTAGDCPPQFNVWLWERGENVRDVVHRSKAVGEPPLMLALSVWHAIYDAVGSTSSSRDPVPLDAPATPENIVKAICTLKS